MRGETSVDGCRLSFSVEGPESAPALLLVNSLGTTTDLWTSQLDRFSRTFRVVRYDMRGHGRSEAPPGAYTLDRLGHDALAVLDAAGVGRADVCGASLGGMVAMWLGVHAPDRLDRLVAANTGARVGTSDLWDERIRTTRAESMEVVAETVVGRWFTEGFRQRHPETVDRFRSMLVACPVDGYTGCCSALRDADLRDAVHRITAPTLVVTGTQDAATPPAAGAFIREHVAGAQGRALDAAHLSNVEQAEAFTSAVLDFLTN